MKNVLWDKLMLFYANDLNYGTPETEIKTLQNDIPKVLRCIAEYYEKESLDIKIDIQTLKDCANLLESLEITPVEETYWETRERLGI